jgi:hypothetical protein
MRKYRGEEFSEERKDKWGIWQKYYWEFSRGKLWKVRPKIKEEY